MTSETLADRQSQIISLVSTAFEGRTLQTAELERQVPEAPDVVVLRFTLDDAYSVDLPRDRIRSDGESLEDMAAFVEKELVRQIDAVGDETPATTDPPRGSYRREQKPD
jgi:hypothetical protein